ncbi:MAG: hypothetical protein D6731_09785 [Planctomycetota bacterium]|nr:MAG: hypothetical protein D6731_09785 [Planctomycetota bacterium]
MSRRDAGDAFDDLERFLQDARPPVPEGLSERILAALADAELLELRIGAELAASGRAALAAAAALLVAALLLLGLTTPAGNGRNAAEEPAGIAPREAEGPERVLATASEDFEARVLAELFLLGEEGER